MLIHHSGPLKPINQVLTFSYFVHVETTNDVAEPALISHIDRGGSKLGTQIISVKNQIYRGKNILKAYVLLVLDDNIFV